MYNEQHLNIFITMSIQDKLKTFMNGKLMSINRQARNLWKKTGIKKVSFLCRKAL